MSSQENMDISNVENIAEGSAEPEAASEVRIAKYLQMFIFLEANQQSDNFFCFLFHLYLVSKIHRRSRSKRRKNWRPNFHKQWGVLEGPEDTQRSSRNDCRRDRSTSILVIIRWPNKRLVAAAADWPNKSLRTKSQPAMVKNANFIDSHQWFHWFSFSDPDSRLSSHSKNVDYSAMQQVHAYKLIHL